MNALVFSTKQQADDAVSLLDTYLGYPRDQYSLHATWAFQHPVTAAIPENPPWAVVLDDECTAAAAVLGLPEPVELSPDWWPRPPGR